jgi:hypothetical protein
MAMDESSERTHAAEVLGRFFHRNGYVRRQDAQRYEEQGYHKYKKGHEVRLVAQSQEELAEIRAALREAGFHPGRPFIKVRQWVQPLYGKDEVQRFLALISGSEARTAGS